MFFFFRSVEGNRSLFRDLSRSRQTYALFLKYCRHRCYISTHASLLLTAIRSSGPPHAVERISVNALYLAKLAEKEQAAASQARLTDRHRSGVARWGGARIFGASDPLYLMPPDARGAERREEPGIPRDGAAGCVTYARQRRITSLVAQSPPKSSSYECWEEAEGRHRRHDAVASGPEKRGGGSL